MHEIRSIVSKPMPDSSIEDEVNIDSSSSGTQRRLASSANDGGNMTPQECAKMAMSMSLAEFRRMPTELQKKLLPYLTPAQVAEILPALAFNDDQLALLRPAQLSLLNAAQVARLFSRLSPEQLAALKPVQVAAVSPAKISQLVPDFTPAQLRKIILIFSGSQILSLLPDQGQLTRLLSSLHPDDLAKLVSSLSPKEMLRMGEAAQTFVAPYLQPSQVAKMWDVLSDQAVRLLRMDQLTALTADQVALRKLVPSISPSVLLEMSAREQAHLASYIQPAQVAEIWGRMSDQAVRLLRPDQLSALTPDVVTDGFERLPPSQWAKLSPGQLALLTSAQLALVLPFMSKNGVAPGSERLQSTLATEQIRQAMGPSLDDDTDSFADEEIADPEDDPNSPAASSLERTPPVLRIVEPAALSPMQVKQMFAQLTPEQMRQLEQHQLAHLSGDELARVLSSLSSTEIKGLLSRFSKEQLGSIPWAAHGAWLAYLPPARTSDILSRLGDEGIHSLSNAHLSALSPMNIAEIFGRLSSAQVRALKPEQLTEISPEHLEQLLTGASPAQLAALVPLLPATQLMRQPWGRKSAWLTYLTPDQVAWLLPHLSDKETKILRPISLTGLMAVEVARSYSKFSLAQLAQLKSAQLANLSATQSKQIEQYRGNKVEPDADSGSITDAGRGRIARDLV